MDIFERIIELQQQLTNLEHKYWMDNVLFTFNWWILLCLFIIPWLIWWKFVDKKRLQEILLYGVIIMILSSILDDLGVASLLWAYPYQLLQVLDRLDAIDITVLPVIYMIIYQYFTKWKSFLLAHILLSSLFVFIAEPMLVWMNIYVPISWKIIYSFPIYIIIAIIVKWFTDKIHKISKHS
ncbi:CBO0543 family protein [Brassicibacter mesophilus]|uniref:CBO0543 family protein n=1 Tax=Brassicibacter mesophilus TaxID=745119 RepID=UPI003D1DB5F1